MAARGGTGVGAAWRRLRYRCLAHLPGPRGLHYRTKYRKTLTPLAEAAFEAALARVEGRACIDLGANLGTVSRRMALTAGRVYAFEPDPWTATELRTRVADLPNVEVIEAVAGSEAGTVTLYRRTGFDTDREKLSQGASTLADKRNVDPDCAIEVPQVDFPAFLEALDAPVAILKMDIEGAEVALLEALFDRPAFARIDHVFVETHEDRLPALAARTEALRRRAARTDRPHIDMNWR
ncbi:methyltransferase, FkbM family [Roseivivax marinus]|uniref:FkbM family methyltransferase n=1 Tax=Roseivivax marinus TaxID=1379903 RepID=UPI0008D3C7CB|nr:FkbM family methyltransferase [Roseivivax marinus]SEK74359.1 methyltransferase, FkbM family [Roseivivax marinus]